MNCMQPLEMVITKDYQYEKILKYYEELKMR